MPPPETEARTENKWQVYEHHKQLNPYKTSHGDPIKDNIFRGEECEEFIVLAGACDA
jgi:hypothetical protein